MTTNIVNTTAGDRRLSNFLWNLCVQRDQMSRTLELVNHHHGFNEARERYWHGWWDTERVTPYSVDSFTREGDSPPSVQSIAAAYGIVPIVLYEPIMLAVTRHVIQMKGDEWEFMISPGQLFKMADHAAFWLNNLIDECKDDLECDQDDLKVAIKQMRKVAVNLEELKDGCLEHESSLEIAVHVDRWIVMRLNSEGDRD